MAAQETIDHISSRLSELAVEIVERQAELDRLTKEHDALQLALNSLQSIENAILQSAIGEEADGSLTYKQRVVFEKIPIGRRNALSPSLIGKRCIGIEPDYVRKTLARLSRYGRIGSHDSKYWRKA